MIAPPLVNDKHILRQFDQSGALGDDRYKITILRFMVKDKEIADKLLEENGNAKTRIYIGVRQADIRNARLGSREKPLIGAGDRRLRRMLDYLRKIGQVKKFECQHKKWNKGKTKRWYFELTSVEETRKLLKDLNNEKLTELLFCLKDLNAPVSRSLDHPGNMLIQKLGLIRCEPASTETGLKEK